MDLSDLNASFNEQTEPQDGGLLELLRLAYNKEIQCRNAFIFMDMIRPFSDYKPNTSPAFRKHFMEKNERREPLAMFVYEKDGDYIMSDDYNSYYLYKELGAEKVPCVVLDAQADAPSVEYISEPYYLEPPSVEII
jgi:hypothetical protein